MTICIAAICMFGDRQVVIGASDRMVTSGDIEFEPFQSKSFVFTPQIMGLVAGDMAAQMTILMATSRRLQAVPTADVGAVANLYAEEFAAYRRRIAEKALLTPLGLTAADFIAEQQHMDSGLVAALAENLQRSELDVATIITGIDSTGAHIYTVNDPGIATQQDAIGFAGIGYGQWHAESQFMTARYTRQWTFQAALRLVHSRLPSADLIAASIRIQVLRRNRLDRFGDQAPRTTAPVALDQRPVRPGRRDLLGQGVDVSCALRALVGVPGGAFSFI